MFVLSHFRFLLLSYFHSLRIVCFFHSLNIGFKNKQNQPAPCYYLNKITCSNKCYTQIAMSVVADYSKRQLKAVRIPIRRAQLSGHWNYTQTDITKNCKRYALKTSFDLQKDVMLGRNQLQFGGGNFHELSFDDAIVLIQPWYNLFANGHRYVLFATFQKLRTFQSYSGP